MGKALKDYNLHPLLDELHIASRSSRYINFALSAPISKEYKDAWKKLNVGQRTAYNCIIDCMEQRKVGAFFIDGPGGTGKTFLYCVLYAKLRSMGNIFIPTTTSGIAASNLPTGRTAHSRFKILVDEDLSLTCTVSKQSSLGELLRQASVIIWDESSMTRKDNIEALNLLLQDMCHNTALFGEKVIVFGGDFRQVLLVLPRKTPQEVVESSLVSSHVWLHLIKFKLKENMRAKEDLIFSSFLLQLGNDAQQKKEQAYVHLPNDIVSCVDTKDNDFNFLASTTFPEMRQSPIDVNIFVDRAILTPRNDNVDRISTALINDFDRTPVTYRSFDSVIDDGSNVYPTEFLNTTCSKRKLSCYTSLKLRPDF